MMPTVEPRSVRASDGHPLAATVFRPPSGPDQVVLVCSAMGVRQGYYRDLAAFIAGRGRAAVTFDYRGIGGSVAPRPRGFRIDLEAWGARDVATMIDFARREFPAARLSVVAHSVGGQILGLAPNSDEVRDVLALGSQSGYWRHWTGAARWRVWLLWHVLIPILSPALGRFPAGWFGLGSDLPRDVARTWAHWGRHPNYVLGRVDAGRCEGYRRFGGRLRAVVASDDAMAPVPAVQAMLEFYPAASREMRVLRPSDLGVPAIGHFGYFREPIGRRFWPAETDWLFRPF